MQRTSALSAALAFPIGDHTACNSSTYHAACQEPQGGATAQHSMGKAVLAMHITPASCTIHEVTQPPGKEE